ncbi:hypothetical protein FXN61_34645 [Lentzea sp. PSKA42]|uniref:Leucine rich repeat variant n=1 Tax=Lentzea indica TaxID=2604800 RepID=A0ABX1FRI4_9PSEU|nr:hypothetical protein [Lentzea indica]NKE61623.1 hypothetical protein [Lentzea indica]
MNTVLDGLAENPALPAALLDRLAQVPRAGFSLAQRPDLTSSQVRALLALDDWTVTSALVSSGRVEPAEVQVSNPWVALAVASHPDVDAGLIRSLAVHPDVDIRMRLAERARSLPPDVMERLAHSDPRVAVELVVHHALPFSLAVELSRHPSIEVRQAVAGSPHTPPSVLVRLSAEDALARWLAGNPATPASIAASLVHRHDARYWLAARTDLPDHLYELIASGVEPGILTQLAVNPAVPVHVLRQLAGTRALRLALLKNPAIPLDLLEFVAETARVGQGPVPRVASASEAELRTLAASTTVQLRMLVALRADLPLDLVHQLVLDPDPDVGEAVVTHPLVTVDQLRELVERHGPRLYPRAARNPLCPPELLHHMALRAGSEETYRAIARHPHAWGETLLLCLEDAQARHLAACHPNLPVATIVRLLASEFTAGPAAANPSLPVHVMEELLSSAT